MSTAPTTDRIAIVAAAGRFPGAPDVEAFWRSLREGREGIRRFSDAELLAAGVDPALVGDPAYVKARGFLEGFDLFDAAFFGFTPREAEVMDPQLRLLLECAWTALERAGCDPDRYTGAVGVFAGTSLNQYLLVNLMQNPEVLRAMGGQLPMLNAPDFLTTWVSYRLNLHGPSVNVQTACSTSLVAVHLACQSLLAGECDLALAGGVSVAAAQTAGYLYQEGMILSPDGHCRTFDARAKGTVGGSGVGVVALKRLDDALRDGDHVHAVILGSAMNNDGSRKVGFTAPSVEGQAAVIQEALDVAGAEPESVQYVEAHGTATPLGDPIEVQALAEAFGADGAVKWCGIGSAKSMVGHLDAAAGVTGLIKAALALEHRELPPTLHFEHPNPELGLDDTPFYVVDRLRPWTTDGGPRRAGVSSFGIGGTNAHVIVEEAPARAPVPSSRDWHLLTLSARTPQALDAASADLAAWLRVHPDAALADVAHTLHVGRREHPVRRAVAVRGALDAAAALEFPAESATAAPASVPVAFLFPGQGTQ
ncbi:MAG TPA: type I polyketide synthase, partial [Longimicrobium sp.]|nr:type I polyketide synthase [Longimicrobium sp.]